jgi:hypothetical protein
MKELHAYRIMFRFLEDRYFRLHSDDIGALLGELALQEDGRPGDLAVIRDWEQAVDAVNTAPDLSEGSWSSKG